MLKQLKAEHPHCNKIIELIEHLHSGCHAPQAATYHTLQWLALTAQSRGKADTALVLCGAQGSGKSQFVHILANTFGERCFVTDDLMPHNEHTRLHIVDGTQSDSEKCWLAVHTPQTCGKMTMYNANYIICTNDYFAVEPLNSTFLLVNCPEMLPETLPWDLQDEIMQGGLHAFADLLFRLNCRELRCGKFPRNIYFKGYGND